MQAFLTTGSLSRKGDRGNANLRLQMMRLLLTKQAMAFAPSMLCGPARGQLSDVLASRRRRPARRCASAFFDGISTIAQTGRDSWSS
eukprot:3962311-Pyramimonas_sp.AAC.1